MTAPPLDEALATAEQAVERGEGLGGTGFWPAVRRVKADPDLVKRYADRMARIDRAAFENWALLTVPVGIGTALMLLATVGGAVAIGVSYYPEGELLRTLIFYVGFGILLVTTHGLAHLLVGKLVGMDFTHWFIGTISRPQPGVKIDYATYLRTPARSRAWMHASGAIVTKALPFVFIGAAVAADLPVWAVWVLAIVGVAQIVTDVVWSTKKSDWKKFQREMGFA